MKFICSITNKQKGGKALLIKIYDCGFLKILNRELLYSFILYLNEWFKIDRGYESILFVFMLYVEIFYAEANQNVWENQCLESLDSISSTIKNNVQTVDLKGF